MENYTWGQALSHAMDKLFEVRRIASDEDMNITIDKLNLPIVIRHDVCMIPGISKKSTLKELSKSKKKLSELRELTKNPENPAWHWTVESLEHEINKALKLKLYNFWFRFQEE
jgi:hypothetical protein